MTSVADAQPVPQPEPPPGDQTAPGPETLDPERAAPPPAAPPVEHTIAGLLVARARALADSGNLDDARLLVLEALARASGGPHVDSARALLAEIDRRRALEQPAAATVDDPRLRPRSSAGTRAMLMVYGPSLGVLSGLALTGPFERNGDVETSTIVTSILGGVMGAGAAHWMTNHYQPSHGEASAVVWSGLWGSTLALFTTDLVTGVGDTTRNHLFKGGSLGALLGTTVGLIYTSQADPRVGDVALVNSTGLYGTLGSALLGVVFDPIKFEAYSVNGLIGTSAGLTLGVVLARRWDTSRGRMLWIDAGVAAGALAPWVVYPFLGSDTTTRQIVGGVSLAGALAGGYLAWRFTRGMGREAPVSGSAAALVPGLLHRDSVGWRMGSPVPRPLANLPLLDTGTPASGLMFDLAGGHF